LSYEVVDVEVYATIDDCVVEKGSTFRVRQ
jgi:hypothetical protein